MPVDYNPYQAPSSDIEADVGNLTLASPVTRLGARILDGFLFWATMIPGFVILMAMSPIEEQPGGEWPIFVGVGVSVVAMFGLMIYNVMLLNSRGQTLGKKLLKIRIIDDYGEVPALWKLLFIRVLGNAALGSIVPFYGLVDPLVLFGNDQQRCIHDYLCGTRVIMDIGY